VAPGLLENAGHIHITEREADGSWEDCTWASGLEWYRLCYDNTRPASHAEYQALRAASGEPLTGGSNIGNLRDGIKARYGVDIPASIAGFANLWSALKPGMAAVAQGSMSAFGPTHPLSTYDRNFDGAHAVFIVRVYNEDRVWWCDPEAPVGSYEGTWVSKADLQRFVNAFNGRHVVRAVKVPAPEETMVPLPITSMTGATIVITTGSARYTLDGKPDGYVFKADYTRVSPAGYGGTAAAPAFRAYFAPVDAAGKVELRLVKPKSVVPLTDGTPFSQAQLDAAVAAVKAPLDAQVLDLQNKLAASSVTVSRYESLKAAVKLLLS
jgi:hypothetical protein